MKCSTSIKYKDEIDCIFKYSLALLPRSGKIFIYFLLMLTVISLTISLCLPVNLMSLPIKSLIILIVILCIFYIVSPIIKHSKNSNLFNENLKIEINDFGVNVYLVEKNFYSYKIFEYFLIIKNGIIFIPALSKKKNAKYIFVPLNNLNYDQKDVLYTFLKHKNLKQKDIFF